MRGSQMVRFIRASNIDFSILLYVYIISILNRECHNRSSIYQRQLQRQRQHQCQHQRQHQCQHQRQRQRQHQCQKQQRQQ